MCGGGVRNVHNTHQQGNMSWMRTDAGYEELEVLCWVGSSFPEPVLKIGREPALLLFVADVRLPDGMVACKGV